MSKLLSLKYRKAGSGLGLLCVYLLAGCGTGFFPTPTPSRAYDWMFPAGTHTPTATAPNTATPTTTPFDWSPFLGCGMSEPGKTVLRLYMGFSLEEAEQTVVGQAIAKTFYRSALPTHVCPEVMPYDAAVTTLLTELAVDNGPDVVGPIGPWAYSHLQDNAKNVDELWLDLEPLIRDTPEGATLRDPQQYDPSVLRTSAGTGKIEALTMAVYPSVLAYNATMFDQAGLAHPPAAYGEAYTLPDGSQRAWNWDTVAYVARLLTLDDAGRNATQPGFDTEHIRQYGFTWDPLGSPPTFIGSYWGAGTLLEPGGSPGQYRARIPEAWKAAWRWTYYGQHGSQRYIIGRPGAFENWYAAMIVQWPRLERYGRLKDFQFAALPSYQGKVHAGMSRDDLYVLKSGRHPQQAFSTVFYLLEHMPAEMLVGDAKRPPAFTGIPVRLADRRAYLELQKKQYPAVTTWDTLLAGIAYADEPSPDATMPNFRIAWKRLQVFNAWLLSGSGDLAAEEARLESDLTTLFNSPTHDSFLQ